jgi:hypothetical protein
MSLTAQEDAEFARKQLVEGCQRMERLLHGLLDSRGRVAEKVHAIRKLGKSLRGGFSLFRLGNHSSPEIQVIGRMLSGPRDAVSRLSTWGKIAWDGGSESAAIGALLAQQTRSAARRPPPETVAWCIERVTAARKHLEELPAETLAERLALGLRKLEKRLIKRCRNLDHSDIEDFHEARKALKAYIGAIGFLPVGLVPLDPKLAALAELLGDENDLATLSKWLEIHGFTVAFVPQLWGKLGEFRSMLRTEILHDISLLLSQEEG